MNSKKMTVRELDTLGIDTTEWNLDADTVVIVCEDGSIDLPGGASVDGPSEFVAGKFHTMDDGLPAFIETAVKVSITEFRQSNNGGYDENKQMGSSLYNLSRRLCSSFFSILNVRRRDMKIEEKKAGHTEGRLQIKNERTSSFFSGKAGQISIIMAGGEKIAVIGKNQEGNAMRLKAAWNACDSIPTEALESGVVGEMRKALELISKDLESGWIANLSRQAEINYEKHVKRINAVLAKAKGEL